jgi:hypothetical protein
MKASSDRLHSDEARRPAATRDRRGREAGVERPLARRRGSVPGGHPRSGGDARRARGDHSHLDEGQCAAATSARERP